LIWLKALCKSRLFPNWERSGRLEEAHWLPSGRRDADGANVLFLRLFGAILAQYFTDFSAPIGAFIPMWRGNQSPCLRLEPLPRLRRRFLRFSSVCPGLSPLWSAGAWAWGCVGSLVGGDASGGESAAACGSGDA